MSKRVQMIPLIVLILCGGISLSSGLYYYDINEIMYPLHLVLMALVYYLAGFLFRGYKRRELISLGISLGSVLVVLVLLRDMVKPGFYDMISTISWKVKLSYGIDLGILPGGDSDYAGLAICQLVMFVTALSLYLYETKRPAVIVAVPSFLLFIVSIIADGVPYEACMFTYGAALIVFLGMGRRGDSVKKLAVLTVSVVAVGLFSVHFFEWSEVSSIGEKYRDIFVIQGTGINQDPKKDEKSEEDKSDKDKQIINYGQFSWEGSITYNQTVELKVFTDRKFEQNALFLRGFVGDSFMDNVWFGDFPEDESDTQGLACGRNEDVRVENVFDRGTYIAYSVEPDYLETVMSQKLQDLSGKKTENTMDVEKSLKKRIENEIVRDTDFETVGDAIRFILQYYKQNYYEYTLYPGAVFYEKDEIENFLFERKTGYCTHFASSAIMIFRTIGIPARLAQGYVVSGDLVLTDKATEIYDNNAHAWVEIYVEGEGWFPIDVTPQMPGVLGDGYNDEYGYNAAPLEDYISNYNVTDPPASEPADGTEEPQKATEEPEQPADKKDKDAKKKAKEKEKTKSAEDAGEQGALQHKDGERMVLYSIIGAAVILVAAAVLLALIWRRRVRRKREGVEETYSTKLLQLNRYLSALWHALGIRWDYINSIELTENIFKATSKYCVFGEDSAEQSAQYKQDIKFYVVSVYKSRYGGESIRDEEYKKSLLYVVQLIDAINQNADRSLKRKVKKYNKRLKQYKNGGHYE